MKRKKYDEFMFIVGIIGIIIGLFLLSQYNNLSCQEYQNNLFDCNNKISFGFLAIGITGIGPTLTISSFERKQSVKKE